MQPYGGYPPQQPPPGYPQQPPPGYPQQPPPGYPPTPPPKKGMSAVAIVLIVLGVLALLGIGTCAAGIFWVRRNADSIMAGLVDGGGLVLKSPPAVTAELAGAKKEYVGAWRDAKGSTLDIDAAGDMALMNEENGTKKKLAAPIAEFRGDDIVIKVGLPILIRVTRPPHAVAGHWEMTADGLTLERK
jgi:hypothetical protein